MALASLDATGLHLPDYPSVLSYIHAQFKAIYGDDIYLDADSQDGQLAAIFAEALYDSFSLSASVYNSFSPQTGQGESLSKQVAINGIRRRNASRSTAILRIVGTVGTILDGAIAKDANRQSWIIPNGTIIGLSGDTLVTAVAANIGDIRAAAGEICEIGTPLLGWHSVVNPDPATPGAPVETDAALRRRQATSTALPSRTVFEGTVGAVAALGGVTRYKGYENDTSETDANGIPGHSIAIIAEGGDAQEIAAVIAAKKTPGCGTHGDVAVLVTDRYGAPVTIRFFQALQSDIAIRVMIRPLPGYLASTGEAVRAALVRAVDGLGVGDNILISKLYTPINNGDASPRTFDVVSIEIGFKGGALQPANLPIAFNAVASVDLADVQIRIAP